MPFTLKVAIFIYVPKKAGTAIDPVPGADIIGSISAAQTGTRRPDSTSSVRVQRRDPPPVFLTVLRGAAGETHPSMGDRTGEWKRAPALPATRGRSVMRQHPHYAPAGLRGGKPPKPGPGKTGALRPVVRARGLRRGLRRRRQGPQVASHPGAGHPGAAQSRSPRRLRLRGQYRRRCGRPHPDAARLFPARGEAGPPVLAPRSRRVCERARLLPPQSDAAAAAGRGVRAHHPVRRADRPRLAHGAGEQQLSGRDRPRQRAIHPPGIHRAWARRAR